MPSNDALKLRTELMNWARERAATPAELDMATNAAYKLEQQHFAIESLRAELTAVKDTAAEAESRWLRSLVSPNSAEVESLRGGRAVPDGFKLVAVKGFDDLMYWMQRCADKGHLENCYDLVEPWSHFEYHDLSATPTPPQAEQAGKRASLTPEQIEEIAQKHSDSSAGFIGGLSDCHVFKHPSLQDFVADVLVSHPSPQPDDARRLEFVYSKQQTESNALVALEVRMLDGDYPTLDEVRAAIDAARTTHEQKGGQ